MRVNANYVAQYRVGVQNLAQGTSKDLQKFFERKDEKDILDAQKVRLLFSTISKLSCIMHHCGDVCIPSG